MADPRSEKYRIVPHDHVVNWRQIEIRIGPPIDLPPISGTGEERRAARQENVDRIMRHIAALLPAAYHGVYAKDE